MVGRAEPGVGTVFRRRRSIAHTLAARGHAVAIDGTSYPYRQAVCVAGLFWGLVGLFFCYRLARVYTTAGWGAMAASVVALGSFILWYLVKEPSMAHAPSMAAVAIFTWLWATTRGGRTPGQWAALGLLAGVMGAMRWQNVLFVLLPAIEWSVTAIGHGDCGRAGSCWWTCGTACCLSRWLSSDCCRNCSHGRRSTALVRGLADQPADSFVGSALGRGALVVAQRPVRDVSDLYLGAFGLLLLWRRDRLATWRR